MAISVRCHWCDRRFRSSDRHRGKTTECPKCGKPLRIEGENLPDHDVFISYSSKDRDAAEAVCEALEAERIRCWIAPRDIVAGVEWSSNIIEAIGESRAMVLIYSSHANESQQVVREVERAVNKRVPIVPVRIEDARPSKNMEYYISASHWLDALDGPIERHLPRVVAMVDTLLGSCSEFATPAGALSPPTTALPAGAAAGPKSAAPLSASPVVVAKFLPPARGRPAGLAYPYGLTSASVVPPELLAGTRRPVRRMTGVALVLLLGIVIVCAFRGCFVLSSPAPPIITPTSPPLADVWTPPPRYAPPSPPWPQAPLKPVWRRHLPPDLPTRRAGPDYRAQLLPEGRFASLSLREVVFAGAELRQADFTGADLEGADFRGADLSQANFLGTDLAGARFDEANLLGTEFGGRDSAAVAEKTRVRDDFTEPVPPPTPAAKYVGRASFRSSRLSHVRFSGLDLSGADFNGAELSTVEFIDADLSNANLRDTWHLLTDFEGAKLHGADFRGADLSSAQHLTAAQLGSARTDVSTRLPKP